MNYFFKQLFGPYLELHKIQDEAMGFGGIEPSNTIVLAVIVKTLVKEIRELKQELNALKEKINV